MAFEDITVVDGRCVYDPVIINEGEIVVCPNGHEIVDVVETCRLSSRTNVEKFGVWRNGQTYQNGDIPPNCHVCGLNPWWPRPWLAMPARRSGVR